MKNITALLGLLAGIATANAEDPHVEWRHYGGDAGNSHYSSLTHINRDTVARLELAWRYDSAAGAPLPASSELQFNPIVIDGVLYGRNPLYNVFAVDARTGRELWRHDVALEHAGMSNMRGVTYWQQGTDKRLFFTTGHHLTALDATNGKIIPSFGTGGRVDLRAGLGRPLEEVSINAPSPGVIYGDLIIMGSAVTETRGAAPGDIRAYDVRSGKLVWTFHTIPHPGEFGHDTWPREAWRYAGGANAWAGMSVDVERGVVYVPTGSPTPDFDGSSRAGTNLFGNSIIALDASSGKRLWHYQTVHHDLWDRDLPAPPTLLQLDGRDLLAQPSKQGVVFLLDRTTGKPVFPIPEVAVEQSEIPGEYTHPTQPKVSLPEPFTRQEFGPQDLTRINADAHNHVKKQFEQARAFSYMQPLGLQKIVLSPGFYGGANWGGGAWDPATGVYYINATEAPHLIHIEAVEVDKGSAMGVGEFVFRKQCSGCHGLNFKGFYPYAPPLLGLAERSSKAAARQVIVEGKGRMMPFGHLPGHELDALVDYVYERSKGEVDAASAGGEKETAYVFAGYKDFVDERYYPAIEPPWGTLNAIDFRSGKRLWQIPLGEYAELTAEGVPITGTRNFGGPIVTAGGLLIIAATADEMLRVFDKENGKLLWQYKLPAAGYSTPATYELDGRQYIVVTCSGGKLGTATGDAYLAFALPDAGPAADVE